MSKRIDPMKDERQLNFLDKLLYGHAAKNFKYYSEKAKFHCANRNDLVYNTLCYLQMLISTDDTFKKGMIKIDQSGAIQQLKLSSSPDMPLSKEITNVIKSLNLGRDEENKLISKLSENQNAHCLPCQIMVNNKPIYQLITNQKIRQDIMVMFGTVDRLPDIFNEVDSHIEKTGLIYSFVRACEEVVELHRRRGSRLDFDLVNQGYASYVLLALRAMEKAIMSQVSMVKTGADQMVHMIKVEIIDYYKQYTRSECPFYIRNPVFFERFRQNWGKSKG